MSPIRRMAERWYALRKKASMSVRYQIVNDAVPFITESLSCCNDWRARTLECFRTCTFLSSILTITDLDGFASLNSSEWRSAAHHELAQWQSLRIHVSMPCIILSRTSYQKKMTVSAWRPPCACEYCPLNFFIEKAAALLNHDSSPATPQAPPAVHTQLARMERNHGDRWREHCSDIESALHSQKSDRIIIAATLVAKDGCC